MKRFINHIRQQPDHIRELTVMICTVVAALIVGVFWFRSFEKNIYTMLNPVPDQTAQDQDFAQQSKSLFGSMFQVLNDSRAEILNLFKNRPSSVIVNPQADSEASVHPLPVSGN